MQKILSRRDVITGGKRLWGTWRRPLGVALAVTIALRVISTVIALQATYGSSFPHVVARTPAVLVNVWAHWDTGYYIFIAQHGYPAATAAHLHAGAIPNFAAFGPAYPWLIHVAHVVSPFGWVACTQIVSAVAMLVGMTGLVHLMDRDQGTQTSSASAMLLVAFPTAFFLLAGYPDSLALCFLVFTFIAARRGSWLLAGLGAAAATMTVFYLGVVVLALIFEIWNARPAEEQWPQGWRREGGRFALTVVPTGLFLASWMIVSDHLYADPLAFVRVQANWGRHFAFPWTLAHRTLGDLWHLRFLDTSTASIMELFDFMTVVMLAILTVVVFVKVRRSYGVLLGACLCLFTFQTILYSETREVLVLFPFFVGLGGWVSGHPWRERLLLALFLPSAFYLITRFVSGSFAG